jgi:hypothetical protein
MPRKSKASRKNPTNKSTHTHIAVTSGTGRGTSVGTTIYSQGESESIVTSHFHAESDSKVRVPSKKH